VPEAAGLLSAWLLGLSLGLTACTVTCLPFMGAWVMARERSVVLTDTALFLAGRVSAYALLGLVAGLAGVWLAAVLRSGLGHLAIGTASIAAGLWLILGEGRHRPCGVARGASRGAGAPPFALGFSLSLTPCAPLASLLGFAAQSGSAPLGVAYGLAFGLGAAVTPLLLLLPLLSSFGARLKAEQAWLSLWLKRGAGLVLLAMGLYRISLWV
jgi:cytochrome c biogenesis protein CcdA